MSLPPALLPPAYTHPHAPARARRRERTGHRPPAPRRGRQRSARRQGREFVGPRAAIRLDPVPARAVCRDQRAGPEANLFRPQGRVGHFEHDAAHVFVGEEIVAGELQVVQGARHVEEEGIAAPAREEAVVAGLRHPCIPPGRDWRSLDDNLSVIASRRRPARPQRGAASPSASRPRRTRSAPGRRCQRRHRRSCQS